MRRSMVKGGKTLPFPAAGQEAIIWPFVKKPIRKNVERITFNIFLETTQTFESKFYAFATSLISFELHSWRNWRVKFNSDPKHPQILQVVEEALARPSEAGITNRHTASG